jgi:hypothetical protein
VAKNRGTLIRSILVAGLALLLAGSDAAHAQRVLTGEWRAALDAEKPGQMHLTLERRGEGGGRSQMGTNYDFSQLQGLTRAQAAAGGPVRFTLAREAGTIECEGSFRDGKGSGTFRFTSNPAFVSAMRARGFDFESDPPAGRDGRDHADRLFSAAALNVTTALADDLLAADLGKLGVDGLFKAAIFKVDARFAREMKASGFPGLGLEELVKARIFNIDADFVGQVARMGLDKGSFESLVRMRIFKVTPEFVNEVREEGLRDVSVEQLVKLRIFNIDGAFIRRAKAEGVPLEVEGLVQRRIGVRGR